MTPAARATRRFDPARRLRGAVARDRLAALAALLVLLAGTAFALLQPLLLGPDEAAHHHRAFQVAHGGWAPRRLGTVDGLPTYGGPVPRAAVVIGQEGSGRQWSRPEPGRVAAPSAARSAAEATPAGADLVPTSFVNSAAYAPPSYAPAALAALAGEGLGLTLGTTMRLMRLAGVVTYAGAVWLVLRTLRPWRVRWLALPAVVLPTAVYQSACISADTMTNAVALLLTALVVRAAWLQAPLTAGQTRLLVTAAVLTPVVKPTYAVLDLLLLVVPPAALARRPRTRTTPAVPRSWAGHRSAVAALAGTGLVAAALTAWWAALSAGTADGMGVVRGAGQEHTVRPADQLALLVADPARTALVALRTLTDPMPRVVTEYFSQTGYQVQGSISAMVLLLGALALGVGLAEPLRVPRVLTAVAILTIAGSGTAVALALALSFTPVGGTVVTGLQGRYLVPLGLLVAVVVATVVPVRVRGTDTVAAQRWVLGLVTSALLLSLLKFTLLMWTDGARPLP